MPLYEYQCQVCNEIYNEFRRVVQCDDPGPDCCGVATRKIISRQTIKAPMEPYESPIDGRVIRNESERRDDLERHGCRPWEGFDTERIEADRQKAYSIQAAEREIERHVDIAAKNLSESAKRVLRI